MDIILQKCPLCEQTDSSNEFDRCPMYIKCQKCGLVYIPRVSYPNYEEDYYFFNSKYKRKQKRRANFFIKIIKSEIKSNNIDLLDVGCGTGHFLYACNGQGWEATGADISLAGIQLCNETNDFQCVQFSHVDELLIHFGDNRFNIITLWEVIEHITDPIKYLEIIIKLLKPGGKLFISTPNVDSFYSKYLKENWHGFQGKMSEYHIRYFNKKSLSYLLDQVGLKIKKVRTISPPADPILTPKNLSTIIIPFIKIAALRKVIRGTVALILTLPVLFMNFFLNPKGIGETIFAVSTKPIE